MAAEAILKVVGHFGVAFLTMAGTYETIHQISLESDEN
jgi:hypothetical protein